MIGAETIEMVRKLARIIKNKVSHNIDEDDLYQEGMLEICQLEEKMKQMDFIHPNQSSYFLYCHVKGAMIDYLRRQDFLSRSDRSLLKKMMKFKQDFFGLYGRNPMFYEISKHLNVNQERLHEAINNQHCIPIDSKYDSDESWFDLLDQVADESLTPEECLLSREQLGCLMDGIKRLEPLDFELIETVYLHDFPARKFSEKYKITESAASQRHKKVIRILREAISP